MAYYGGAIFLGQENPIAQAKPNQKSLQKRPISLENRPVLLQKRYLSTEKRPISLQKRPISLEKRPPSLQKRHTSLKTSITRACENFKKFKVVANAVAPVAVR